MDDAERPAVVAAELVGCVKACAGLGEDLHGVTDRKGDGRAVVDPVWAGTKHAHERATVDPLHDEREDSDRAR